MTLCLLLGISAPIHQFAHQMQQLRSQSSLVGCTLLLCTAIAYLALWRIAPENRVFGVLGLFFFVSSFQLLWIYLGGGYVWWAFSGPLLVESAAQAMRIRNHRWTWFLWPLYIFPHFPVPFVPRSILLDWSLILSEFTLAFLFIRVFRTGALRERKIALVFLFYAISRLSMSANLTSISFFLYLSSFLLAFALTFLGAATLYLFVRDLIFDRREKIRLQIELEQARSVQQVLVPEDLPVIPGLAIASIYKPAGQVGGDFYQILPISNGGVLLVIGDVSGKGMPAAMTVSLLVGTVRTLAHYTQSPGEILAAMNLRMLGRSSGGFTTCLVLRLDRDGRLTVANAGHIAPYVGGREMAVQSGLPLGLAADATYAEAVSALAPGSQMTLVTDGVVEARNKDGELMGFEQTAAISTKSADQIAEAAQAFGQDDDITVVTVTRLGGQPQSSSHGEATTLFPSLA